MKNRIITSLISLLFISSLSISQIAANNKIGNINEYFRSVTLALPDGNSIEEDIIDGPPTRPEGFDPQRATLPEPNKAAGVATLAVPAFNWFMGCSATSGSMIASYYDRNGYPNMYTGPTNGGIMPLDNSSWPTWNDGHATYGQCPLTASHNGLDGRAARGSIDDYWVQYNSSASDPYITNGWTEHTWGDAIADYMKTSQSTHSNVDGSTKFYNWGSSASQLTCSDMVYYSIQTEDGTYGRKLFYEARGYTVTDCYNQKTDNTISGGFSFAQFQAEINAGRPVMLNLQGHTIVGVGYNTSGNTVYIHDTWDYSTHTMTWGGSYSGMQLLSVSIVILAPIVTPPGAFNKNAPANGSFAFTNPTLTWGASSGATSYEYCYDTSNNNACDTSWISAGSATSAGLSGLTNNRTYYWQVRAVNSAGNTQADSNTWWSFTARTQRFADVPIDHQFWAYIEAMYNAGITTGCGVSPLIYCPEQPVTRAAMAVFLLRAKYGSSYTPPAVSHFFADMPVAGKEWMEPWVDQLYREGITTGCGTDPLIYCPESSTTRAAMAVFILRALYGSSYTPPTASHFFSDVPTVGKEWMEPWIDELYREGITTGCGTSPLIDCPETAVKRGAMAAFLTRAFSLPMP